MQSLGLTFLLLCTVAGQAVAGADAGAVGTKVEDFQLRDYRGAERRLSDWHDRKLLVVVFFGVDCPLAKLYAPRLVEMAREFEPQGVSFLAINSNQQDSISAIDQYVRVHHLSFPVLKDVGNEVADQFGAKRTPEVFVLDEQRQIRYRGRIDDQYAVGAHRGQVTRRDLAVALSELLAGQPVSQPETKPAGCFISRLGQPPAQGPVTYCRDIAPIVQQRCIACHRPGQVAPFSLTTYRQAVSWAETITEVLQQRRMPPWHANPDYGKFANDARLPEPERQRLFDWISDGCPEGNPADLPPLPQFHDDWHIPAPDQVVAMPEPFTVPAEGIVEYQHIEVDPGFREDKWIRAAEIRPGNRSVVHHCTVFLKPPGNQEMVEQGSLGSFCLAATAPGTPPLSLPDGMAKLVPAGWHFVFVVHYTTIGSVQTDQTRIGLVFADPKTVQKEVATKVMVDLNLSIPPHAPDHVVEQTWLIHQDVLLLAMFPHMHFRGKSFRYEAFYPDGSAEILLDVPHYDFNWQNRYVLAEAKRLPAGARLRCTAHYDNSENNPVNPDPDATVHTGSQTWDEMFNGYFEVALADQDLTRPSPWYGRLWPTLQPYFQPQLAMGPLAACGLFLMVRRSIRRKRRLAA